MPTSPYTQLLSQGPFAGRPDPFAEDDHYFGQLHGSIIDGILEQIRPVLLEKGYYVSKEASLQIADMRKPDMSVFDLQSPPRDKFFDYPSEARAMLVEPGVQIELEDIDLRNIHIWRQDSGKLVTVVEIISPRNKTHLQDVSKYQTKRLEQFLQIGVNVVEIDLTRSVKRLTEHPLTSGYPYHVAIFMPGELARIIPLALDEPLKKIALPLSDSVVVVELQDAYNKAYEITFIPVQIEDNHRYAPSHLPFRSLLADWEYQAILQAVTDWHEELARLQAT